MFTYQGFRKLFLIQDLRIAKNFTSIWDLWGTCYHAKTILVC